MLAIDLQSRETEIEDYEEREISITVAELRTSLIIIVVGNEW